jgi:hypothetical protein
MPGISLPIIDNLLHPPFGVLHRTAEVTNPQAGPFVALAPPFFGLFPAYGAALRLGSVGAFHGRDVSSPVEYDPPLGKLSLHYTDADGIDIVQQVGLWMYDNQPYLWETPLPSLLVVYTQPDVILNVWWFHT